MRSYSDRDGGHYRCEIYPAWQAGVPYRWGAIIHDYRSALDNLVWQLVILNGGEPDSGHSFPICRQAPTDGFADPDGIVVCGSSKGLHEVCLRAWEAPTRSVRRPVRLRRLGYRCAECLGVALKRMVRAAQVRNPDHLG